MSSSTKAALSYHEPPIETILILTSFLLLLNIVNYVLDKIIYCGLIGQILIGIAWGLPGAKWLSPEVQNTVMQVGYLGLILIVYEGGLSTNLKVLRSNLALSSLVAAIGVSTPIALSFILLSLLDATPLQAFAAGAALCSTSLGTTFTILSTSGLTESRLGVILTSAAMIDDVIGLIMVQVISNLGGTTSFDAVTVVRPIGVSIAFAVLVPLACTFLVKPATRFMLRNPQAKLIASPMAFVRSKHGLFLVHTAVLIGMVIASSYAGTSNLFAAYLAGVVVTWSDGLGNESESEIKSSEPRRSPSRQETPPQSSSKTSQPDQEGSKSTNKADDVAAVAAENTHQGDLDPISSEVATQPSPTASDPVMIASNEASATGLSIYHTYYHPITTSILKPFFFASIGFSIPISQMFIGRIVWRGFVYATLMTFGKLLCGVCLIRFSVPVPTISLPKLKSKLAKGRKDTLQTCLSLKSRNDAAEDRTSTTTPTGQGSPSDAPRVVTGTAPSPPSKKKKPQIPKPPRSLYPASILGAAMVARGEIGFLVSSIAQSNGIFAANEGDEASSDLFLVVTWAILICTVVGPVAVGLMVKRVRRLQEAERKGDRSGREDPLGVWGVVGSK